MKKLCIMTAAMIALAAVRSAGAADLRAPVYKAPAAAPVATYTWSGFYLGINAGYGWGDDAVALSGDPGGLFAPIAAAGLFPTAIAGNAQGFVGGGQVGWNYQTGRVVLGVEGDLDATDIKSSGVVVAPGIIGISGIPRTLTGSQRLDWLATFRGRFGFTAVDRLLVYATGGGAAGEANTSVSLTTNAGCTIGTCEAASQSQTLWGWSLGAGLEYAISGNWSVKAEYLHYDLGHISITAQDPHFAPGTNVTHATAHFSGEIVRAGLNYKFDWGGPVAARY